MSGNTAGAVIYGGKVMMKTFNYKGKTYEVRREQFGAEFPYVQVYQNGKPYGVPVVPSIETYMKYLLGEDTNFFQDLERIAETDITSGMWDRILAHKATTPLP
jgi:hypothetical protein